MPVLPIEELQEFVPALKSKLGVRIVKYFRKKLSVTDISDAYDRCSMYTGGEFADHLLQDIGVDYQIGGNLEILKQYSDKPFITISNHPYGGIDGVILADLFTKVNSDYKIMVNRFLSRVEVLMTCCIQVDPKTNKTNDVTGHNITATKQMIAHVRDGKPVGLFPAGAVSDLKLVKFKLADRDWQDGILKVIKKMNVPIIPVRFLDHNSRLFYILGIFSWKLRILRLPHELINKKGSKCRIVIGNPISPEQQDRYETHIELGKFLRKNLYSIKAPDKFIKRSSLR